jgi:hypothetical protein
MNAMFIAGLLLLAAPAGGKTDCKDKGKQACKGHDAPAGKRPSIFGGKRGKSESKATAICNDHTFWRAQLDESACDGHGGVKEPL